MSDAKDSTGPTLSQKIIAEVVGTFILVWFGCGAVMQTKYTGAMVGLGQPAMTWVLGGALAVYTCGSISGGHLNPAVSLAFALVRPKDFPFTDLVPYAIAQTIGAFAAAAVNFGIYREAIYAFEADNGFVRNESGHSYGGAFGCYPSDIVASETQAVAMEVMGTAMLTFVVFSITHPKNNVPGYLVPALVGVAIGSIIAIIGSLSGGAINPARDLGPRLYTAYLGGWGNYAFEGLWIYMVGPFVGGPLGAIIADGVVRNSSM